jgi:hypothetical protein
MGHRLTDLEGYPFIRNATKSLLKALIAKLERQKERIEKHDFGPIASSQTTIAHPFPECKQRIILCTQAEIKELSKKGINSVHFSVPAESEIIIGGEKTAVSVLYFVSNGKPFNIRQKKNSKKGLMPTSAVAFTYQNNFFAPDFSKNPQNTIQMYTDKKGDVFYFTNCLFSKELAYPINAIYAIPSLPSEGPRYFSLQADPTNTNRYEIVDHKNNNYTVLFENGIIFLSAKDGQKFDISIRKDVSNNPVIIARNERENVSVSVLLDEKLIQKYGCTTQKSIAETIETLLYHSMSADDKTVVDQLCAAHASHRPIQKKV